MQTLWDCKICCKTEADFSLCSFKLFFLPHFWVQLSIWRPGSRKNKRNVFIYNFICFLLYFMITGWYKSLKTDELFFESRNQFDFNCIWFFVMQMFLLFFWFKTPQPSSMLMGQIQHLLIQGKSFFKNKNVLSFSNNCYHNQVYKLDLQNQDDIKWYNTSRVWHKRQKDWNVIIVRVISCMLLRWKMGKKYFKMFLLFPGLEWFSWIMCKTYAAQYSNISLGRLKRAFYK